jgi:hypothetical protein
MPPRMPPRFSFNADLTSSVNAPLYKEIKVYVLYVWMCPWCNPTQLVIDFIFLGVVG